MLGVGGNATALTAAAADASKVVGTVAGASSIHYQGQRMLGAR